MREGILLVGFLLWGGLGTWANYQSSTELDQTIRLAIDDPATYSHPTANEFLYGDADNGLVYVDSSSVLVNEAVGSVRATTHEVRPLDAYHPCDTCEVEADYDCIANTMTITARSGYSRHIGIGSSQPRYPVDQAFRPAENTLESKTLSRLCQLIDPEHTNWKRIRPGDFATITT